MSSVRKFGYWYSTDDIIGRRREDETNTLHPWLLGRNERLDDLNVPSKVALSATVFRVVDAKTGAVVLLFTTGVSRGFTTTTTCRPNLQFQTCAIVASRGVQYTLLNRTGTFKKVDRVDFELCEHAPLSCDSFGPP